MSPVWRSARARQTVAVRRPRVGDGLRSQLAVHRETQLAKPGLDHVDARALRAGWATSIFSVEVHAAAGGLLAVAQGRVKNLNAFYSWFRVLSCSGNVLSHSDKKSFRPLTLH